MLLTIYHTQTSRRKLFFCDFFFLRILFRVPCIISPKSLPDQHQWGRGGQTQTSYSKNLQWQSIQALSKFHPEALDPSQGELLWVISYFWETSTSETESSVTPLVFTSLALMVTNFFAIIKTSFILIAVWVMADHNFIFTLQLMKRVKGLLLRSLHKVNGTK